VYRTPRGETYHDVHVVRRGEQLACLAVPDVPLTVDEILG
jgi:hypothetical protein